MAEFTLTAGTVVHERYRIVAPIGRGGMGAVYEAIDERLGHRVALKQTLLEGDVAERAFEREAKLLAALRHPALPVVSDFFSDERGRFLVMQFIPGKTVAELVLERGGSFPVAQALGCADALLRTLEYLHGQKPAVLHRDIKPANLKLTSEGEVVLLDFGLAKGSGETTTGGLSVYGLTPQYAPLEQFQGSGTDARSDLYALAGTLYFLMTHAPPMDALTRASALGMGKADPLAPPRDSNAEIPPRVASWLTKALAVHKEDRYPSAAEMRRELTEIRSGLTEKELPTLPLPSPAPAKGDEPKRRVEAAPTAAAGLPTTPAKPARRRAWPVVAIAAAVVLVVAIAVALVLATRRATRPAAASAPGAASIEFQPAAEASFEVAWPGDDYWNLDRGDKRVANMQTGKLSRAVTPGRYRVAPALQAVFEPIEFTVSEGQRTIIKPAAGSFEFAWAGDDYWNLDRGDKRVANMQKGEARRFLAPGRYRVEPALQAVFEPVEFTVSEGKTTTIKPASGTFDFQWAGDDYWNLDRGDKRVADMQKGPAHRFVAPGRYRLAAFDGKAFGTLEFTVVEGQNTVVKPK